MTRSAIREHTPGSQCRVAPHRPATSRPRRVALYSHDTQGLGHVRRNILVAAALVAAHPDTDVLLLTGAPEATALPLPARTEVVTVPSLHKDRAGDYHARILSAPLADVLAIRSGVVEAALTAFAPDLLVVDKVARGVHGELDRPLRRVRELHGTTTVLGLRDVLDGTATTVREWRERRTDEAVRDLYDRIWVYGDPALFDPAVEYGWPASITSKVDYTGYLSRGRTEHLRSDHLRSDHLGTEHLRAQHQAPTELGRPFALGLVGGGQDGAGVARAFAAADFPAGHAGVLITGPYLEPHVLAELRRIERARPDLLVLAFVPDVPAYVRRCAATVSMGGYNSVCELLAAGRPTLLVPRTVPRTEQAVRAERLRRAGLADVHDICTITAAGVTDWLSSAVARPPSPGAAIDLDGLARLPRLADRLLVRRTAMDSNGALRHVAG